MVKPNFAELSHLVGRDLAVPEGVVAAARQLLASGTRAVLCSLGGDGAIVVTDTEGAWRALVPPVQVVSPVGCGDASVGGYVSAAEEGLGTTQCIQWALAAGSACAATFGAGFASRPEVEALVPQVRLESLSV
jgi:fructose-1-phosphate kinase PfkB-like protein